MRLSARMGLASGLLAAVLVLVFVVLALAIGRQRDAAHDAYNSEQVIDAAGHLRSSLLEVEAAERGFLLTGQHDFLVTFRAARAAWPGQVARLEMLVADDPAQAGQVQKIREGMRVYVDVFAAPLVARARRGLSPRREPAAAMRGNQRADHLRAEFRRFVTREEASSATRDAQAMRSADRARVLGAIGLVVSLGILGVFFWVLSRAVVRPIRQVAGAARGLARGDLSVRVPWREGGSEVHEMGSAFNAMAGSLQDQQARLEEQNAALDAQRGELEGAVQRLAAEKERMARYLEFGRRLDDAGEADVLGAAIVEQLAELTGADRGVLYATELERTRPPTILAHRGFVGAPPAAPAGGPMARALAEGETVCLGARDGARLFATERDAGSELAVPLVHGGIPAGLLVLGRRVGPFADDVVSELEALAQQAAAALASSLALRRAQESASVIRAVLDSTPDAIALLDRSGRTVLENPPMRSVRQALVESVRTPGGGYRTNVNLLGPDRSAEVRDELELRGTGRTFARYAAPVRDGGGAMIGRLTVLREITGEREAERLKDEFFALVSHELRTPLTSIIGYLELVLDEADGSIAPDHRRYLEVVQRNATRLLRLVGDLLFVAQVEAGKLSLDPGSVSLPQIVEEAVEAARPVAEARAIDLRAEVEPVPDSGGDRDRLGQVLDNLVTNALKFTPEGGEVTVRLRRAGPDGILEVADTGTGIPPEEQGQLFERFFRASTATAQAVPGVGLGLTIVKAIVEAHGGTVSVDSAPGTGTTFRVDLPLRPPAPPPAGVTPRAVDAWR